MNNLVHDKITEYIDNPKFLLAEIDKALDAARYGLASICLYGQSEDTRSYDSESATGKIHRHFVLEKLLRTYNKTNQNLGLSEFILLRLS